MQSRLNEFSKLAQQYDTKGMIEFINHSLENGRKDEMKQIIALTRISANESDGIRRSRANIYQYAIDRSAELLNMLKKHDLIPASFYKSADVGKIVVDKREHSAPESKNLGESAVARKDYLFIRNHMQANAVDTAAKMKLLYQAAIGADFKMVSLILNYLPGNTPLSSCYTNESSKKMENYPVNPVTAQKFQNNLFLLFKGSRYDQKSVVYEVNEDCVRTIHTRAF